MGYPCGVDLSAAQDLLLPQWPWVRSPRQVSILLPDEGDELWGARLLQEASAWRRVRHPNVQSLLDLRKAPRGLLLIQECVSSWTLASILATTRRRGEQIPLGVASAILSDVLLGLHAIHETTGPDGLPLRLLHRSLTPYRVLVGFDGSTRLGLPDFLRGDDRGGCRGPTATIKGNLGRLAPEEIRGLGCDRRTDLHGVALLLWEVVTGRLAFQAESDLHRLEKILRSDIEPPSTFRPELPPDLERVILQGLAVLPEDRFEHAPAMLEALLMAVPPCSPDEVRQWVSRLALPLWTPEGDLLPEESTPQEPEPPSPPSGDPYRTNYQPSPPPTLQRATVPGPWLVASLALLLMAALAALGRRW
jgi:serine/threonine protein kinase